MLDLEPEKLQPRRYDLERCACPNCGRTVRAKAPGVLPKALYGNMLLAKVAEEHYLHGHTLGDIATRLGINNGSLFNALHQLAGTLEPVATRLVEDFRQAPVKHADETPWRTDGVNGYAWLFSTRDTSVFRLRETRAATVPEEVFGKQALPGVLVVDRYAAYNRVPCSIQYCYAHLMRDVEDLEKEFHDDREVVAFTNALIPLLAKAMKLRAEATDPRKHRRRALRLKEKIVAICAKSARHAGIQQIQGIFREKAERLYHWAESPNIPADNNFAERDLRGLVIARKISFGSQSEQGRRTREVLMTILHTLKKRGRDPARSLKTALDLLAGNSQADLGQEIFPSPPKPAHLP